jgi:hypothetical protein
MYRIGIIVCLRPPAAVKAANSQNKKPRFEAGFLP